MDSEITDLRSRSMRDNILIHNIEYNVHPGRKVEIIGAPIAKGALECK